MPVNLFLSIMFLLVAVAFSLSLCAIIREIKFHLRQRRKLASENYTLSMISLFPTYDNNWKLRKI